MPFIMMHPTKAASACALGLVLLALATVPDSVHAAPEPSFKTPPMGWMSWEIFRCQVDCANHNESCINEYLYKTMTDELVAGGYLEAGYNGIHLDDCWMQKDPPRNAQHQLVPDPERFPSGFKALGDYIHSKNVKFAIYTAESTETCGGYPASKGYEQIDADTFASWGVDYVKVDGCGDADYYATGYPLMGAALEKSGRAIEYSCSWPAYLGSNETTKPYASMIASGCNLWRNWADIQCSWGSLSGIIDHYGDYSQFLQKWAAPGHVNDPDMLLIGNDCITDDEARTQMAIWSLMAAPLIMGNDLRIVPKAHQEILLNPEAISVDQDPLVRMGVRITPAGPTEIWARNLANGDVAVGLYNRLGGINPAPCPTWNETKGGYVEASGGAGGDIGRFSNLSVAEAQKACCERFDCAGFSYEISNGSGYYKANTAGGIVKNSAYDGYTKPHFAPPSGGASANITILFADVGFTGKVSVRDIWTQTTVGVFSGSYTAEVPYHGTAFLRLSQPI